MLFYRKFIRKETDKENSDIGVRLREIEDMTDDLNRRLKILERESLLFKRKVIREIQKG